MNAETLQAVREALERIDIPDWAVVFVEEIFERLRGGRA